MSTTRPKLTRPTLFPDSPQTSPITQPQSRHIPVVINQRVSCQNVEEVLGVQVQVQVGHLGLQLESHSSS